MYPKGERIVSCVECWRRCIGDKKWYCTIEKHDIPLVKGETKGEVEIDRPWKMISMWREDMQQQGWKLSKDNLREESQEVLSRDDHVILSGRQHAPGEKWTCVDVDSGKLVKTHSMHWNGERRWWSEVVGAK